MRQERLGWDRKGWDETGKPRMRQERLRWDEKKENLLKAENLELSCPKFNEI